MGSLSQRVPTPRLLAFALPAVPAAMLMGPLGNILPAFYATYTAVGLSAIGAILLFTRLTDAVTDQLIGYLSDITRSRFGPRKPWILAGTPICMIAGYALFTPAADSGAGYFLICVFFLYLGWTMIMVPHQAWMSELSRDYSERARIATFSAVGFQLGGLMIFIVPLLPGMATTEIGPEALAILAGLIVLALPTAVGTTLWAVPPGQVVSTQTPSLRDTLRAVMSNRPFWWFLIIMILSAIALGMVNILLFLFISNVLQLGARLPHLFLTALLVTLLAMPIWLAIMRRIGKHRALALGGALNLLLLPFLWFMQPGDFTFCLIWMIGLALVGGVSNVAPIAIVGDIIDYDILKTGVNRAGNYYAFLGMMQKSIGAVGGSLAFFMLDAFGFDPKADVVDAEARFGILATMSFLPGLITLVAIVMFWYFPIDARRHNVIRRRLQQRQDRAERAAAALAAS